MTTGEVIGLVVSVLFFIAAYFGTEIFLPVDPESTPLQKKTRHFWALVLGLSFFLMSGVCSFLVLTRMDYEDLRGMFDDRFNALETRFDEELEDLRSLTAAPAELGSDSTPEQAMRVLLWELKGLLAEDRPEIGTDRLREELKALATDFSKGYLPLQETDLTFFLSEAYMSEDTYRLPYIVATNLTGLDEFFPGAERSDTGNASFSEYSYFHKHALGAGIPVIRLFVFKGQSAYCGDSSHEQCWAEYTESVRARVRTDYPTLASVMIDVEKCRPVIDETPADEEGPIDLLFLRDWSQEEKDQLVLVDRLVSDTWERKQQFFVAWSQGVLSDASAYVGNIWRLCEKEVDLMAATEVQQRYGKILRELELEETSNEPLALQLASKLVVGRE